MYQDRSEDLSPVVTYRHKRILWISEWMEEINKMLEYLYKFQETHKKRADRSVSVQFWDGNNSVHFDFNLFSPDKHEFRKESHQVMCDVNKSMLAGYITFLEAEREGLIREWNRLETAKPEKDGEQVQN